MRQTIELTMRTPCEDHVTFVMTEVQPFQWVFTLPDGHEVSSYLILREFEPDFEEIREFSTELTDYSGVD
jgi:hypothetical protein